MKPRFQFSSTYSEASTLVSDLAASLSLALWHSQDVLLSHQQSWARLGSRSGCWGEKQTAPSRQGVGGPPPTSTGFCEARGGAQSTKISKVVSLRRGNYTA